MPFRSQMSNRTFSLVLSHLSQIASTVISHSILSHLGMCFLNQTQLWMAVACFALNSCFRVFNFLAISTKMSISALLRRFYTFSEFKYCPSIWTIRSSQSFLESRVCKLLILVRSWWYMQKAIIWAWTIVLKKSSHVKKFLIFILTPFWANTLWNCWSK